MRLPIHTIVTGSSITVYRPLLPWPQKHGDTEAGGAGMMKDRTTGPRLAGRAPPVAADDAPIGVEAEEVVRCGDVHVHGIESLCVGESQ